MDLTNIAQTTLMLITAFALKGLGAIVVWLVARRVIAYIARLVVRSLKYPFDQTGGVTSVYFDTNRAIRESFGEAGFPAPEQNVFVRSVG